MGHEHILSERFDGAALITLNRPDKLNALSFGLMQELDEELTRLEDDDGVKAVVLIGAGDKAFSAGADIHEMAGLSAAALADRQAFRNRATWHVATFAKPPIGAINGLAYGGAALLSRTWGRGGGANDGRPRPVVPREGRYVAFALMSPCALLSAEDADVPHRSRQPHRATTARWFRRGCRSAPCR